MPNNPKRKTRITNQLRLNSKKHFKTSLKYPQPIIIEDKDNSGFSNMEEMAVHTLKKMTRDTKKLKFSKGESSWVQFATVKIEYPVDSSLQQDVGDFVQIPSRILMEFPQMKGYPQSKSQMTPNQKSKPT
jgi:hypothetical protein